jgi:hypothetical protein
MTPIWLGKGLFDIEWLSNAVKKLSSTMRLLLEFKMPISGRAIDIDWRLDCSINVLLEVGTAVCMIPRDWLFGKLMDFSGCAGNCMVDGLSDVVYQV